MQKIGSIALGFLLLAATAALAFPFPKKGGVTELTPKTLPGFLNTHKPVFIMFYAPWCGHCKSLHPDYQKFGDSVKDVIRVGAVNADEFKELGGKYGIKGFPTIKYWKMGDKKGQSPIDYQGQRTKAALQSAAMREATPDGVTTVKDMKGVEKAVNAASDKRALVLFSTKKTSPALFSVLAVSPHFKGKISFVLVTDKAKEVVSHFGAAQLPMLALVGRPESDVEVEGESTIVSQAVYEGKLEYTLIAKWLQSKVLGEASQTQEDEAPPKEEPKQQPKKDPRPATPVRPIELSKSHWETFCSPGTASKVRGQQPFCVVAMDDSAVDLKELHRSFLNEAVLFFWVPEEKRAAWKEDLSAQGAAAPLGPADVLVLRAAKKDKIKAAVWRSDDVTGGDVGSFLSRVIGGEVTFERRPEFPELRE